MRMKGIKAVTALAAACIFAAAALHLSGCSRTPTDAKGMMELSVEKLGGLEKATGWKTMVSKGLQKQTWPGWGALQANATHFIQKPDKLVLDQDFSAFDHPFFFRYSYNAGEAWVMVNLGVRQNERYTTMLAEALKTVDGIAYYLEHSDTLYIVEDAEPDSLHAGAVFARIAAVEGADTVYFDLDKSTWLPLRAIDKDAQGTENHNIYDDYREVDGFFRPFHETTYQNGTVARELIWETIEIDVEIEPEEFEKNRPKSE